MTEEIIKEKRKHRRFSIEDDQVIISYIKKSPTNLRNAIEQAAEEISADFKSVENRYYNSIKKNHTIITCGSSAGMSSNVKNSIRKEGEIFNPKLKPHVVILKQLLDLPDKELELILSVFK